MSSNWQPKAWIAILLGVFLHAFTFLYLNRAKLFWGYFILISLVSLVDWKFQTPIVLIFSLICPVHAYFVAKKSQPNIPRRWFSKWWGIVAIYVAFIIAIVTFRAFLYEPYIAPSSSMAPTIKPNNHIVVSKLGFGTYQTYGLTLLDNEIASSDLMVRGKIYAFYPPNIEAPYVKRLIALPGDTLTVQGQSITLNGQPLQTELLSHSDAMSLYQQVIDDQSFAIQHLNARPSKNVASFVVPENHYFFMGDNRDNSVDSRYWGAVSSDRIIGEVVYILGD